MIRGELGGFFSSKERSFKRENAPDDATVSYSGAGAIDLAFINPSAATTAATNMDTLEQASGRGSDNATEIASCANGKEAGALKIKTSVRENMNEEKGQGNDGERRDRFNNSRKEEEA